MLCRYVDCSKIYVNLMYEKKERFIANVPRQCLATISNLRARERQKSPSSFIKLSKKCDFMALKCQKT